MELKPEKANILNLIYMLLIVPYGIETSDTPIPFFFLPLLIVPYGIETSTPIVS